jgi:hypothetical protein
VSYKVSIGGRQFQETSTLQEAVEMVSGIKIVDNRTSAQTRTAYVYDKESMADWTIVRLQDDDPKVVVRQLHNEDGSEYGH